MKDICLAGENAQHSNDSQMLGQLFEKHVDRCKVFFTGDGKSLFAVKARFDLLQRTASELLKTRLGQFSEVLSDLPSAG